MRDVKTFFQYVLECLEGEVDAQVKSDLSLSNPDDRTYAFLKSFPSKLSGINRFIYLFNDEKIKEVLEKASPEQGNTKNRRIVIGYPTMTKYCKSNQSTFKPYIFPIVYWRVTDASEGLCKGPYIHVEFIKAIMRHSPNQDFFDFLKDQGISVDLESLDSVATMVSDLCKLDVAKNWRVQSLDPKFVETGNFIFDDSYKNSQIFNRIIVAASEGPSYTAGLIDEIKEIEKRPPEELKSTALGSFMDCLFNNTIIEPSEPFEGPILENGRNLNIDQRKAVRQALTSKVSLIQGPPGTGKTQVVKNLYLNALKDNQKVLFTSKNSAAVNAVTGNEINKEPLTLTKMKYEDNNNSSLSAIELLDNKIHRISTYLNKEGFKTSSIDKSYDAMKKLQKKGQEVEKKGIALEAALAELREYVDNHDEFLKAIPDASSVKEKDRLFRTLSAVIKGTFKSLDAYKEEFDKPLSSKNFLLSSLFLFILRWRLTRNMDKLRAYLSRAGFDPDVVNCWEEAPDLVKEELESYVSQLAKYPFFKKYEEICDRIQSLGTFFDIDKALFNIDRESVKLSETIIKGLPALHASAFSPKALSEWKRLCSDKAKKEEALIKAVEAVRCVAVKALSFKGRVPLKAGLFDLAIVDEAGQVDVFSLIPVLFRAKRVAVIGDPKQLAPIVNLEKRLFEQIKQHYQFAGEVWPYTDALSFYDLSLRVCPSGEMLLKDHYRCHPDISTFVSRQFYEGHLIDAMMAEPSKPVADRAGIFWEDVDCDDDHSTDLFSQNEVPHVVDWAIRLVRDYGLTEEEIGVITPFRMQADSIGKELKNAGYSNVLVSTAHGFQGGERRVIIYSLCLRRHLRDSGKSFLANNDNLFNVAVTRAKEQLIIVGDKPFALNSDLHLYRDFASYVEDLEPNLKKRERIGACESVSAIEMDLARAFDEAGIHYDQQVEVGRYVLDFAITAGKSRLNLEVDGERFHMTATGKLRYYDRLRNQYLMDEGWDVKRYWAREVKNNPQKIVAYVRHWINNKDGKNYVAVETN